MSVLLKNLLREQDFISRWGGDELLILLTETEIDRGFLIAERVRQKICNELFLYHGIELHVTITFGISQLESHCDADQCIIKADQALIEGKKMGKNIVIKK